MGRLLSTAVLVGSLGFSATAIAAERSVSFAVENMTCASCPYIVKTTMARVPGVSAVDVSYGEKTATVTFDDAKTSAETIAEASAEIGYPATPSGRGRR